METLRLHLGNGNIYLEGYVNVDISSKVKTDMCLDLNQYPWPFQDSSCSEIICGSNILGFLSNFPKAMSEIHRIATPDALIRIEVPIYPSMDCFSDLYAKKVFTWNSFDYYDPDCPLNYYVDICFKRISRKFVYSKNFKWLECFANKFQKFHLRILNNIIPASGMVLLLRKEYKDLNSR